jgi:DHA2 family multidrug resistance protein
MLSVGALQLFLDRGEVDDWFASTTICWLFAIFVVTFWLFLSHSWRSKNPIINIRLFMDRSFAFGTVMMAFFSASIFGCIALIPQMLESLFGYTSELSGISMAPRGIASAITMGFVSQMMTKGVDARIIIATGLAIGAYTLWLMSDITLDTGLSYIVLVGAIQGIGIGCFFMPLSTMVYASLPNSAIAEASGLFNFGRNIGNAIGISLLVTFLDRDTQANWNQLGGHINKANPNFMHWLKVHNFSLTDPHTYSQIANTLNTQANFIAYMHTYRIAAIVLIIACFMTILLKSPKNRPLATAPAH